MGKSPVSMVIFNSKVLVYQRVNQLSDSVHWGSTLWLFFLQVDHSLRLGPGSIFFSSGSSHLVSGLYPSYKWINPTYPSYILSGLQLAIENDHRNSGFSH